MDTDPLAIPSAMYWPSLDQEQQLTLPPILCFCTAFCSEDHTAISESAQLKSWCDTGLNCTDCTASLCLKLKRIFTIAIIEFLLKDQQQKKKTYEYFKIPSNFEVHIMTVLSAPPDANFFPSLQ